MNAVTKPKCFRGRKLKGAIFDFVLAPFFLLADSVTKSKNLAFLFVCSCSGDSIKLIPGFPLDLRAKRHHKTLVGM